jgi:GT2 family glycosyltransferase
VSVDVIIVNWNGGPELLAAIESGRRFGAKVIVVDNASTTGSIGAVEAMADVQVVRNSTNGGFGYGCNSGVAAGNGDIVMLLNPDAQIISGTAADLEGVFATYDATMVAFPIEHVSGQALPSIYPMPTARSLVADILRLKSLGRRVGLGHRTEGIGVIDSPDVSWVVGSALAMRRSDWLRLGGMDEGFFLWFEDVDLGIRVVRSGGAFALAHAIRVQHIGASTWVRLPRRRRQWLRVRGSRRLAAKHLGRRAVAALVVAAPFALAVGVALDVAHWVMRRP